MAFRKPDEIAELAVESGVKKVHSPLSALIVLGFLGGAFIALGYLLDIRVIGIVVASNPLSVNKVSDAFIMSSTLFEAVISSPFLNAE